MKHLLLIFAFTSTAMAQEAQVIVAEPAATAEVAAPAAQVQAQQPAQVVIIQEPAAVSSAQAVQQAAPQAVVTQPTTVVESTPLVESNAEKLRRTRQQAEVETEQKIVEKLEQSRLEDEQKRMQNLFGAQQAAQAEEEKKEAAAAAAPVVVVAPAAEEKKEDINKEELKTEIAESVKADLSAVKEEVKAEKFKKKYVFGAAVGSIDYEIGGIDSDFIGGFTVGYEFRKRMELEGAFNYSKHRTVEPFNFAFQEMQQYNYSLGIRYAVLPYFITPVVGGIASYTHRRYSTPYIPTGTEMKSDSIDLGFIAGADVVLSENMSIGFDYRWFTNIENRVQDNPIINFRQYTSIEDSNYDVFNLALRYKF